MKLIRFLLDGARGVPHSKAIIWAVIATGIISGLINTALLAGLSAALTGNASTRGTLLRWFALMCILLPAARFASEVLLNHLSSWGIFNLRMELSRKIISTPLRRLEEIGPHRLLATLTEDIPVITNALTAVPLLCMHGAIVVGCMAYLCWLSWGVFLSVAGFMALGLLSYQLPLGRAVRRLRLARELSDALFKHLRALTEGTKELKLNRARRESFLSETLVSTAADLRRQQFAGNLIYTATRSWGQLLVFVLIGLLVFAAPQYLTLDSRVVTGYALVLLYMMSPLEIILSSMPIFGRANVAVRKVEQLGFSLAAESTGGNGPEEMPADHSWQTLELDGVTHTYYREGEDEHFTLGPINLTLKPGELVFLLGGNGSGKTTLAKVITGLYAPESGEVRLDGRVITDESRDAYRQNFSAVFSDFYLFESLLGLDANNLDEKAREYLVQLHLSHKVRVEGGKLSTVELSHGQRKRLALLTAYLEDRPFYVFDEWAADQDPLFKEIFYFDLLPKLKAKGKAVLVISHDQWYFHVADRLVKLEYGQLESDASFVAAKDPLNEVAAAPVR